MKNFIIASLIFAANAIGGVLGDYLVEQAIGISMPTIFYYIMGWISAGSYIAIKEIRSKKGN